MTYEDLRAMLAWQPSLSGSLPPVPRETVVGGMGGSALPAHALRFLDPSVPISAHRDYGLPEGAHPEALYVAISYSGNTAETLSFAREALERGFSLAVISSGGELAQLAQERALPFVRVPEGFQPRDGLLYLLRALAFLLGRDDLSREMSEATFDEARVERDTQTLAAEIADAWPLFYAARRNGFLAYSAKVFFNETGKAPAAANVFPELAHNELQAFDASAPASAGAARFVFMRDREDDPRVKEKMEYARDLLRARGRRVVELELSEATRARQLARGWFTLRAAAIAVAQARGADPVAIPLIEEFKKKFAVSPP